MTQIGSSCLQLTPFSANLLQLLLNLLLFFALLNLQLLSELIKLLTHLPGPFLLSFRLLNLSDGQLYLLIGTRKHGIRFCLCLFYNGLALLFTFLKLLLIASHQLLQFPFRLPDLLPLSFPVFFIPEDLSQVLIKINMILSHFF